MIFNFLNIIAECDFRLLFGLHKQTNDANVNADYDNVCPNCEASDTKIDSNIFSTFLMQNFWPQLF